MYIIILSLHLCVRQNNTLIIYLNLIVFKLLTMFLKVCYWQSQTPLSCVRVLAPPLLSLDFTRVKISRCLSKIADNFVAVSLQLSLKVDKEFLLKSNSWISLTPCSDYIEHIFTFKLCCTLSILKYVKVLLYERQEISKAVSINLEQALTVMMCCGRNQFGRPL